MRIRAAQMAVFRELARASFHNRMLAHLRTLVPDACSVIGDHLPAAIDLGIERARAWGLTSERHVGVYTDAMIAFGVDFDRDPGKPWAWHLFRAGYPPADLARLLTHASIEHGHEALHARGWEDKW